MSKDSLYYCFRYKCKRCPKNRECEEKEGEAIEKRRTDTKAREVHTKRSQWYEPKTSIQRSIQRRKYER